MSSGRFLTGKILIEGKRGKFALASGEETNNREKPREVYNVRRTTNYYFYYYFNNKGIRVIWFRIF